MPTRKQRKRLQKERRHEYETVWVDADGNELEEAPDIIATPAAARQQDGKKPQQKHPQQRTSRTTRVPQQPSWRRAAKRSVILGVVIFALFSIVNAKGGKHQYSSALLLAVLYTVLFVPFTFYVDRFTYRRWERKEGESAKKR
jgi:hypothetical protein